MFEIQNLPPAFITTLVACHPLALLPAKSDGFESTTYATDPAVPIKDIKETWEAAKSRAARILKGIPEGTKPELAQEAKIDPLQCRFHDLRHSAVSRMLDAGIPIIKVAKIVGWSPATMVRMAARSGHFTLEELRPAVETISRAKTEERPPVFPPVPQSVGLGEAAN